MSQLKVNAIRHTGASSDAITLASDGKATYAATSGTSDFTISDGNLVIGTSGHGIDFSATSDASGKTGELLSDYEEGTFTPQYSSTNGTYSRYHEYGYYTKIGNVVTISAYIQSHVSSGSGSGSDDIVTITGIPFAPAQLPSGGNNRHAASLAIGQTYKMEVTDLNGYIYGGQTYARLYIPGSGTTGTQLVTNQIDSSTTELYFSATYRV